MELHKDIIIEKSESPKQQPYIPASKVDGTITFESDRGIVYLCQGTTISGEIIGGKIESCSHY